MNRSTDPEADLKAAVEKLYIVFSGYSLQPGVIECSCPSCVTPEEQARLRSKPLRELSSSDLWSVAESGLRSWGTANDYRYLLPRLFELNAFDPHFVEPVSLLPALQKGDWRTWPEAEQNAVKAYLTALWQYVLSIYEGTPANDWLCAIAFVVEDLTPFLALWRDPENVIAMRHLAYFVYNDSGRILKKGIIDYFWEKIPDQNRKVVSWLLDPLTRQALEQTFFAHSSEPFADDLALAVDQLESLRSIIS